MATTNNAAARPPEPIQLLQLFLNGSLVVSSSGLTRQSLGFDHREQSKIGEEGISPLLANKPKNIPMREAVALPLIFITAWEGLVDRAHIKAINLPTAINFFKINIAIYTILSVFIAAV